jgi:hypothetical protein
MSIGGHLLRYSKDQLYHGFDKETEGLNLFHSRPWQIAWATARHGEVGIMKDRYPFFADLKLSKGAAVVNRFNYEEYKSKATDPREVLEEFEKDFLNPEIIKFGHNIISLDIPVYFTFRRALGLPVNLDVFKDNIFLDTNNLMKAYKKGIKVPSIRSREFVSFNFKMSVFHERNLKTNLALTGKEMGIQFDYDSLHRGNNDVVLNKLVLDKIIWMMEI